MTLIKLLTAIMVLHMGFGVTQFSVTLFTAEEVQYGDGGFISHTPLESLVPMDDAARALSETQPPRQGGFWNFLNPIVNIGDTINGLATFRYDMLTQVGPDEGFVYTVVLLFRIIPSIIQLALAVAMFQVITSSGLLNSTLGQGAVLLGAGGLAGSSLLGGLFGG